MTSSLEMQNSARRLGAKSTTNGSSEATSVVEESEPATEKPEPATKKPEPATKKPEPATKKPEPATKKPEPVPPVAGPVHMKRRHFGLLFSFLLLVAAPVSGVGYYLYEFAKDQFTSEVGFTVRREEAPMVSSLISSLGQISSASSSDSDILFEYIRSQQLVQRADKALGLRALYSQSHKDDPVFSLKPDATIEELVLYWNRMVQVSYAQGTGLLELEVRAFDPLDAQKIARLIFSEGSAMINELSSIAREDVTRYAKLDLKSAEDELQQIRENLTRYRLRTQIVDPTVAIQGQMGLLNSLQQQLGTALIELDLLGDATRKGDPRLTQVQNRIAAIEERIGQERQKFGQGGDAIDGQDYATILAEFERLTVEREFAEQKYATALSNLNISQTEAQRQSRYLAAYVGPTLAESAKYPQRILLILLCFLFAILGWAILALVYYSLRDRR